MEETPDKCPLGICDGSGVVTTGEFDNLEEKKCPHLKEESGDEHMQDPE